MTAETIQDVLLDMRNASPLHTAQYLCQFFADRIEAALANAEPIGWVFQHEGTGLITFCENDGVNTAENFAANNRRHVLCGPAYTTPRPIADLSGLQRFNMHYGPGCFGAIESDNGKWVYYEDVLAAIEDNPPIDLSKFRRAVTLMQDAANRWMAENPHPRDVADLEGYAAAQNDFDDADRLLALIDEQEEK